MLEPGAARQRILCVQEGTAVVDRLRPLLADMEFSSAGTGATALDQARDGLFDLYIVAKSLPDMQAGAICREIRQFDPHTPILLCFHEGEEAAGPSLDSVGSQGYITNPVDAFAAPQVITNSLATARQRSIDARLAERYAVQDEIAERLRDAGNELASVRKALLAAREAVLMSRAYDAFAAAGGMRADFKRMWPAVFEDARSGKR